MLFLFFWSCSRSRLSSSPLCISNSPICFSSDSLSSLFVFILRRRGCISGGADVESVADGSFEISWLVQWIPHPIEMENISDTSLVCCSHATQALGLKDQIEKCYSWAQIALIGWFAFPLQFNFPVLCCTPKDEYLIKLDLTLFAANYNWQRFPDSQRCHLPIKFLLHVSANTFDWMEVELVRNCKKCEIFFCDPGD